MGQMTVKELSSGPRSLVTKNCLVKKQLNL